MVYNKYVSRQPPVSNKGEKVITPRRITEWSQTNSGTKSRKPTHPSPPTTQGTIKIKIEKLFEGLVKGKMWVSSLHTPKIKRRNGCEQ